MTNHNASTMPIEELDAARSTTSALTPRKSIAWALMAHDLPTGERWTPLQQAEQVLRFLEHAGYRVVAKDVAS